MKKLIILFCLIIFHSCINNIKNKSDSSDSGKEYKLIVTTGKGDKFEQKITKEQANELYSGANHKRKYDTIYNSFNKPKVVSHYLSGKIIYEYFNYNDKQQLISRQGKKEDSSAEILYREVAHISYKYKNELLEEKRYYNLNNELISSKWEDTPIIQYKYDTKGNLTEEWFLNKNEQLRDEYAILKYKNNNQISGWYNIKGESKEE